MNYMEEAVLKLIEKHYHKKFVGGIKVTKLGTGWSGYKLTLSLRGPDAHPIQIAADLEAEDFLNFVEQELISRQLHKVEYFTGIKIYPEDETNGTCRQNE